MKPSIPKGTRDFSPLQTARRNYIFDTIRGVFSLFGYNPIETPAMELITTLMGKYGEEGDRLLYRVQNSGADASLPPEKGLRYDLTVPFARYVVQHRGELTLPFRRSQIQPVWRADRPQKGRYREFYQCDADVVGSPSLLNEVELLQMVDEVFRRLRLRVTIKLNNRKVLAGIAQIIGEPDKIIDITTAIDKLDKIPLEAVEAELAQRGLSPQSIQALRPILQISGTTMERLDRLDEVLKPSAEGSLGVEELRQVITTTQTLGLQAELELDVALARGLNYYTGTIIEVKARDHQIGSISGGGRYDNLTGIFGMSGLSGVGVSFGADRIYDALDALGLFPPQASAATDVLFVNFGPDEALAALKAIKKLRNAGISAELYPDAAKMKKQMGYANDLNIPYVAIIGSEETAQGKITLKNMATGEQRLLTPEEAVATLQQHQ